MKDTIIKELEGLDDSALSELSSYIGFLKYKIKASAPLTPDNILKHFKQYGLLTWKDIATAIRNSGIPKGPVGGYMPRYQIENWLALTYKMEEQMTKETIDLLRRSGLLNESYNGNIN